MDGDLAYRTDSLAINRLDVDWQGARASASGTIGLAGRRALDLALRADALQVSGLLSAIERSDLPVTGTLSAMAQVAGTANPAATVRVVGSDLVAYNEALGTLTADTRLVGRQLDVTSLQLDKPQPDGNGRILATGSYHLDSQRYTVDLRSQDVKLLTLEFPDHRRVTGAIDLTARSSGTLAAPSGNVAVRADDLVIGDYTLGTVTADTTLADALATTVATAERFALTAKSTIGTSPSLSRNDRGRDWRSRPVGLARQAADAARRTPAREAGCGRSAVGSAERPRGRDRRNVRWMIVSPAALHDRGAGALALCG